jgi:hypothetical protein
MELRKRMPLAERYAADAAEAFRAYAGWLERGRRDFDSLEDQARSAGLTVMNRCVLRPVSPVSYCPAPGPGEDRRRYEAFLGQVDAYNQAAAFVGTWWGRLEAWVAEHLAPLATRVSELNELADLFGRLRVDNEDVVDTALEYSKARADRDLSGYRQQAESLQTEADRVVKALRSGNPAVRAAADAANPHAMRQSLDDLTRSMSGVARYGKVIPVAGGVIDVVTAGTAIADGASAASVGAGLLGNVAGGAMGGVLAASVAAPPLAVAGMTIAGAVLAGTGASWAWEAWVPLDVREAIDDALIGERPLILAAPRSAAR